MSELDFPYVPPRDDAVPRSVAAVAPRVLLASRSPRRTSLLREAGIGHEAAHPGFDDAVLEPGPVEPGVWIASLAYLKAWAKWRELSRACEMMPRVIVGADTACLVDGDLVGTPTTASQARAMLARMVGRDHEVITGVAAIVTATGRREVFMDRATVTLGDVSDAQIDDYVASGAWQGKAGAYNLSERVEAGWPIRWEGDPTTIMGLPMRELQRRLGPLLAGTVGASEVG